MLQCRKAGASLHRADVSELTAAPHCGATFWTGHLGLALESFGFTQIRTGLDMTDTTKARPVYRNIHVTQILSYRLPPAGWVSILHRISGMLIFVLLPFVVWMFDASLSSEISYDGFTNIFVAGVAGRPRGL